MNHPGMLCFLMVVLSSQSISDQFTLQDYRNHLDVSLLFIFVPFGFSSSLMKLNKVRKTDRGCFMYIK